MKFFSLRHQSSRLVPLDRAREFQLELLEKRARGEISDTVLFVEHPSTITQGRGLQWTGQPRERHMPLPVLPKEIVFTESERGGDLTWHGPGQLVIYPIVKLDGSGFGPNHDVTGYLRKLERVLIAVLEDYGLRGEMREQATGVWVGEKKIASIGIAVRKWVTYHGAALNVVNDLAPFQLFSPCGYSSEVMTSLAQIVNNDSRRFLGELIWRERLESVFTAKFASGKKVEVLDV